LTWIKQADAASAATSQLNLTISSCNDFKLASADSTLIRWIFIG